LLEWSAFRLENLLLDQFDCSIAVDFDFTRVAVEEFDCQLHSSSQPEDKMESGFLLDVIIGEGSSVF